MNCQTCSFTNEWDTDRPTNCSICNTPFPIKLTLEDLDKTLLDIKKDEIIDKNYIKAYETIPESFFQVPMIYIPAQINDVYQPFFIDTGAQTSVMSLDIAEKCGLSDLIDRKYKGELVGVGSCKILGRVHYIEVVIGSYMLPCSFTIMESSDKGKPIEVIFGLDMMSRHKCILDLGKRNISIGDISVEFL